MNDQEEIVNEDDDSVTIYEIKEREAPSHIGFRELSDRTNCMDLRDLSKLITNLKRALLCTEALEDIDDKYPEEFGEAHFQYFTALDHLGLAATALKLAHIKHKKGE